MTASPWSFPAVDPLLPDGRLPDVHVGGPRSQGRVEESLPDPVAWSAARAIHEIGLGTRPVSHLVGRATDPVLARLTHLASTGTLTDARLVGVRSQRPLGQAGHVEVVLSFQATRGRRVIALRLDQARGWWRISAFQPLRPAHPAPVSDLRTPVADLELLA